MSQIWTRAELDLEVALRINLALTVSSHFKLLLRQKFQIWFVT